MSVTRDDPGQLPEHRRPPSLGGRSRHPVWGIAVASLGVKLSCVPDRRTHHCHIEPASSRPLDTFTGDLAATVDEWSPYE